MIIIRRVVGHSMLPVLPPKTNIVALRFLKKPKVGSVVVVLHEGREKIKRIQEVKDNQILAVGDNNGHDDSHSLGWLPQKRIVGRVIWPKSLNKIDE